MTTIIERLEKLIAMNDPKATYNFERDGVVLASVSHDPETNEFSVRYPKQKAVMEFDDLTLIAEEVYDLLFA
jgi:uncharacterized protein YkuJ